MLSATATRLSRSVLANTTATRLRPSASAAAAGGIRWHGGPSIDKDAPTVHITFINPHPAATRLKENKSSHAHEDDGNNNNQLTVEARVGETFLQVAHRHDIDLEGACEGGKVAMFMSILSSHVTWTVRGLTPNLHFCRINTMQHNVEQNKIV